MPPTPPAGDQSRTTQHSKRSGLFEAQARKTSSSKDAITSDIPEQKDVKSKAAIEQGYRRHYVSSSS
jgi:hypothetical protein